LLPFLPSEEVGVSTRLPSPADHIPAILCTSHFYTLIVPGRLGSFKG